jgi:hypothetical protein
VRVRRELERPRVRSSARGGPQQTIDLPLSSSFSSCRSPPPRRRRRSSTGRHGLARPSGYAPLGMNVGKPRSSLLSLALALFLLLLLLLRRRPRRRRCRRRRPGSCSCSRPSSCVDGEARRGSLDLRLSTPGAGSLAPALDALFGLVDAVVEQRTGAPDSRASGVCSACLRQPRTRGENTTWARRGREELGGRRVAAAAAAAAAAAPSRA